MSDDVSTQIESLATTLENFIIEQRTAREAEMAQKKNESEKSATEYQKTQTFFKQHGVKIIGTVASIAMAILTWYGNSILNAYKDQQRAAEIDRQIKENSKTITEFKIETVGETTKLENAMVEQRVLTVEAVGHLEKVIEAAHPRLKESELPEKPPILRTAEDKSKIDKGRMDLKLND